MYVGTGQPGSSATVALRRSLLDVTDRLVLGAGAALHLDIEGDSRIGQYGAVDVHTGVLGGALEIAFDFTPIATSMIFDLIVSGLLDGLTGDFASVDVLGLDPIYAASTGFEIDTIGGSSVEIYRLRIARTDVPEPGTLALVLLALATVLVMRPAGARRGRLALKAPQPRRPR